MASSSSMKNNHNNQSILFRAERPHFYKIILRLENKLRIPSKFVRNYGHHLATRVILKVPTTGAEWKVEIVRSAGGGHQIWLQNGWRRFTEYYSIAYGSFLLFEYGKKNGDFNVTIFDRTTTEIDYPLSCSDAERANNLRKPDMVDEVEDDVSVEILDHFSRSRKTKAAKSPTFLPSSRPNKKIKLESTSAEKCPTGQFEGSSKQPKEEGSSSKGLPKLSFSCRPEAKKLSSTMSRSFSNNRTFQISMSQSYVHPCKHNLPIPADFSRMYMKRENGDALFKVSGGRTWTVKYYTTNDISGQTRTWVRNSSWKEFARENQLQVGDVCKFELIDPHKTLFEVVICRTPSANAFSFGC